MFLKIKFVAKYWSDLCNFYSKVIVLNKVFFFFLFLFLIIDVSQQYCETFRKSEQEVFIETLPKLHLPYRLFWHNLFVAVLTIGKTKIFYILKKSLD